LIYPSEENKRDEIIIKAICDHDSRPEANHWIELKKKLTKNTEKLACTCP
jgi:hypothetical protein